MFASLVDRVEGKNYVGAKHLIRQMLVNRFYQYKKLGCLKGVIKINNTWYIG